MNNELAKSSSFRLRSSKVKQSRWRTQINRLGHKRMCSAAASGETDSKYSKTFIFTINDLFAVTFLINMKNLEFFSQCSFLSKMFHIQYKNDGVEYFLWDFYILNSKLNIFISLAFTFQDSLPSVTAIWRYGSFWSSTVWWCNFHKRARFFSKVNFLTSVFSLPVLTS